jgi:hypothetical protein
MTDQISGFVQFFQNLLGTAPPQLRAVPQRGAPIDEIRDFVDSLHLPPVLCAQLTDGRLSGFANHFRLRNIDPADPGACARFTKDCLDYYSCNASPEFLNGADAHGMTPLMCALKSGDFDLVQDLRQHGAVVDSKVLKFAVKHEVPEKIIKYLFK